jgi:Zn-dependent peptidase ImmA (M78 family)
VIERIGETVRTVRERAGGSLEDLAAQSGVPVAVLAALEQGQRGITTTQLDDVAMALSLDPVALLNGREVPRCVPSVFLRHQQMQDFDDHDGATLDDALEQGRSLANLRRQLGEPALALQAGEFTLREPAAHRSDAPAQDGYRLAREVRRWLGNPVEPLGDIRALIEEQFGIAVVVRRLESKCVTAVCVRAESSATIVLEARDPQRAQNSLLGRVYLAHELCHALFDPSRGGLHIVIDVVLDRKAQAAEQRARAFAAELLLPREGVKQMIDSSGELYEQSAALDLIGRVRSRFGTPHPITANHLCNHGLISAGLREWLEAGGSTFAGTPPETTLPDVDAPSLLVATLAERAHGDGLLTDSEARATLGLDKLAPLPWEAEL